MQSAYKFGMFAVFLKCILESMILGEFKGNEKENWLNFYKVEQENIRKFI